MSFVFIIARLTIRLSSTNRKVRPWDSQFTLSMIYTPDREELNEDLIMSGTQLVRRILGVTLIADKIIAICLGLHDQNLAQPISSRYYFLNLQQNYESNKLHIRMAASYK